MIELLWTFSRDAMSATVIEYLKKTNRLSQIKTNWTQLIAANQPKGRWACDFQKELLLDYSGAVYRYLLGAVRDDHVASDLAQEFAVRFLRGDFCNVTPEKGRFRDFLKRTLGNLANDYFRSQKSEMNRLQGFSESRTEVAPSQDSEIFEQDWVTEVLRRTWEALAEEQSANQSHYYTVLRARAESPQFNSKELCVSLSGKIAPAVLNEPWLRQTLSRARKQFADLLRREVAKTLRDNRPELVDDELAALGLLQYCR